MRRIYAAAMALFSTLVISGCAVGPNYQRPPVNIPATFRDTPATPVSLADTKWFDLFHDAQLTILVNTALRQNFDLRAAATRVLQARAQVGIARADLYPNFSGSASFTTNRGSSVGSVVFVPRGTDLDVSYTQAGFSLNWELDLWGRIRRLNEAARAQYLSSEAARRGVVDTLVSDVTSNYFNLRESDLELEIAQRTKAVAERSLKLTTLRRTGGVATSLDVRQSEQFLYTATATIAAAERQVTQTENAVALLLGENPEPIARGKTLEELQAPPDVPAGLPSTLLLRRPDVRQAELDLVAANANIGAAKAQYFPTITLTGLLGAQSRALTSLFTGPARDWNFVPQGTIPLFDAGRIRNNVRLTEALRAESTINYQRTIATAFREVADALIGYRKTVEQRQQEELLVKALVDANRLSEVRYKGGLDSYLQVLDAQRSLFQGQLDLARLRRDELKSVVTLYRALGGGWEI